MASTKLKGTGSRICSCGAHKDRCIFGHAHSWSVYFKNGQLVGSVDTLHCHLCDAVCDFPDDESAYMGSDSDFSDHALGIDY